MPVAAAMKGVLITIHDAASATARGTIVASGIMNVHSFEITGAGTVAAGAVIIESASDATYTGLWNPVVGNAITVISGKLTATFNGNFPFLSARISTTVSGTNASVSVSYVGN